MELKNTTISPKKPLKPVLDYEALRAIGLQYIEKLGSAYWTDYNAHDPGITTLESLCYALTETGYRMQFGMADLLAAKPTETKPADTIFTARSILTTHPVTVPDYRKLLIDQPGVANAWLAKATNVQPAVFADCKQKKLTFDKTKHQIQLKGLWDVLLELENDDAFGNLNANQFEYKIVAGPLAKTVVEFVAHQRVEIAWKQWLQGELLNITIAEWTKTTNTQWDAKLVYRFDVGGKKVDKTQLVTLFARGLEKSNPDDELKTLLKGTAEGSLQAFYIARERAVLQILQRVETLLHNNRNLCEDFRNIALVSAEEVSFCADIETRPEADLEEVEAKIIMAIENYLSPEVPFYNLAEMLQSGLPTDQIFDGPALQHGFIKDDELAASALRKNVYTSDIINLIMDIEGVLTVSNFVMSKFSSTGKLITKAEPWALNITENHKPRYARSKSKWLFFKNHIPFITRKTEVDDILQLNRAEQTRDKLLHRVLDLELPAGNYRELDQYFTVLNDFPPTYAIGADGFPANATQERVNQAKQLQGYLLFYDQILANFLAQIEHFKDYISLEPSVGQTYFTRFLHDLPSANYIYKDAVALQSALPKITEDEDTFFLRRNRVLDHLLGRFQEGFNDYVLMLYTADGEKKAGTELISDKINFLKTYPETSSRRFTGINYTQATPWPVAKSAGLKQRVSRLAGINKVDEDFIMSVRLELSPKPAPAVDTWQVVWKNRVDGSKLFASTQEIVGKENAHRQARKGFQRFVEGAYLVKPAGAKFRVFFGKEEHEFKSTGLFSTLEKATEFALEIYNSLTQTEGMNLFEHLLLRPHNQSFLLMDACIPDNCAFCGDEDPYSFKLSIVLPYWPTRFRKIAYRRLVEQLAHTECPAHLLPKVCWADPFAWQELEDAWHSWLHAQKQTDETVKMNANARLIRALEDVETVYPEAVLHDCEDDKDENPVILNQTKLGIF